MLLILAYILFGAAYVTVFLTLILLPQVIAILPLFEVILVYFTWQFVSYDISVCLDSGCFTVTKTAWRRKKQVFKRTVADVTEGGALSRLPKGTALLDFRGTPDTPTAWYLAFGVTVVVFEATKKLIATVRYYKPHAAEGDEHLSI